MRFEKVPVDLVDWSHLDAFEDRPLRPRPQRLARVVRQAQRGEIVVARLLDRRETVGFFAKIVQSGPLGVRIMGSPTCPGLGDARPRLQPGARRRTEEMAIAALLPFVFHELGCLHLELADPLLGSADVEQFGFDVRAGTTFVSALDDDEDALFAVGAQPAHRRRKSEKWAAGRRGGVAGGLRRCSTTSVDVFAKQQLRPDLRPGARRAAGSGTCIRAATCCCSGARERRRPQHRQRDLPGLQPALVLLGPTEPARAPDPASERGHPLVRDAATGARADGARTTRAAAATTSRRIASRIETLHFRISRYARDRRRARRRRARVPCRGGSSASATWRGSSTADRAAPSASTPRPSVRAEMRPARIERATSASAGLRSIP